MTLQLVNICGSIAALSVSGVTIADVDEIPPDVQNTRNQILFPEPDGFITNFTATRDSFGPNNIALQTVEYDLNYTYCHVPLGAGRTGLDEYDGMVTKVGLIFDAILDNVITTDVDVYLPSITEFGLVPDPSGNIFLGCRISIHCKEFVH
jgi:hypothetical protein